MTKCERCWKKIWDNNSVHTCTPWLYLSEHEKLKIICDKIWYKPIFDYQIYDWMFNDFTWYWQYNKWTWQTRMVNVREILFAQEFMNKYQTYIYNNINKDLNMFKIMIMSSLDNPVDYLFNLLELWTQK